VREWPVMAAAGFVMMLLVVLTASLGYLFEHEAQPDKFENIPQAVYWAVITLASVGYGDITPVTPVGRFLTIILALIGIGIFAIPAALLSSAFSDQLITEREELKDSLIKIIGEGDITDEKAEIIRAEAERLHLTEHEVDKLLDRAIEERDALVHGSKLPLSQIAQDPAHAVEHFKVLVSEIRQLSILSNHAQFESFAKDNDRLTQSELALWQQMGSNVTASTPAATTPAVSPQAAPSPVTAPKPEAGDHPAG